VAFCGYSFAEGMTIADKSPHIMASSSSAAAAPDHPHRVVDIGVNLTHKAFRDNR
jgi:hypothetical protein